MKEVISELLFLAICAQFLAMTYGKGLFQNSKSLLIQIVRDNKIFRYFVMILIAFNVLTLFVGLIGK